MKYRLTQILLIAVMITSCKESFNVPSGVPSVVKINNNYAYVTYGEDGMDIIDLNSLEVVNRISPVSVMGSIDDIAIDGNLLFTIDARSNNYLAVYSIENPQKPKFVSGPVAVEGGPFNGVSAAVGNVVVSGGTTFLSYRQYDAQGNLSNRESTFGRDQGHPDVLLSSNGTTAYVSTDFDGQNFGILTLALEDLDTPPVLTSELVLPGAGFTSGTTTPVGFPIQSVVSQDHLIVAHGGGLSLIELVNGSGLNSINTIDIGIEGTALDILNDVVYVCGNDPMPSLVKIDISDINNPSILETINLNIGENIPTSIAVNENHVIIAAGSEGMVFLQP